MIKEEWWSTKEVTNEVFQGAVSEFLFAFCPRHITEHELTAANKGKHQGYNTFSSTGMQ